MTVVYSLMYSHHASALIVTTGDVLLVQHGKALREVT